MLADLADLVTVHGPDGSILYANDAVGRLFGDDGAETMFARQRLHPDDVGSVVDAFGQLLAGSRGPQDPFRYRMFATDGTVRVLEARGSDRRDDPTIGGVLMMIRDVTEHEVVAAEHRVRSSHLAALLAALSDAVLFIDNDRRILYVNEAFGEMFRIESAASDLVGRIVTEDLRAAAGERAEKPERFEIDIDATYAEGRPRTFEVELADGRVLEARYMPVHEQSDATGHLWIYRDISERRHAERMKDEFLASVSHELRTPLTSVVSFTDLLLDDDALGGPSRAMLEAVRRNAERLQLHVHDLLLVAQLERGGYTLRRESVDVLRMVACAADALAPRAAEAGVSIDVHTADGPELRVDPDRIEQVLVNLLSNAIKFNRPGGAVSVRACCDGPTWTISVGDTGIGIPERDRDQLFQRFFRATNAREAHTPGTGLGLAISRSIVELHGGTITIDSAPGVGTTVCVQLPVDGGASAGDH